MNIGKHARIIKINNSIPESSITIDLDASTVPANYDLGAYEQNKIVKINLANVTNGGLITSISPIVGVTDISQCKNGDQLEAISELITPITVIAGNETAPWILAAGDLELTRAGGNGAGQGGFQNAFGAIEYSLDNITFDTFQNVLGGGVNKINVPIWLRNSVTGTTQEVNFTVFQGGGSAVYTGTAAIVGALTNGWRVTKVADASETSPNIFTDNLISEGDRTHTFPATTIEEHKFLNQNALGNDVYEFIYGSNSFDITAYGYALDQTTQVTKTGLQVNAGSRLDSYEGNSKLRINGDSGMPRQRYSSNGWFGVNNPPKYDNPSIIKVDGGEIDFTTAEPDLSSNANANMYFWNNTAGAGSSSGIIYQTGLYAFRLEPTGLLLNPYILELQTNVCAVRIGNTTYQVDNDSTLVSLGTEELLPNFLTFFGNQDLDVVMVNAEVGRTYHFHLENTNRTFTAAVINTSIDGDITSGSTSIVVPGGTQGALIKEADNSITIAYNSQLDNLGTSIATRNEITIPATEITLTSTGTTLVYNTSPGTGQISVSDGYYYDEGTTRHVFIPVSSDEDDLTSLQVSSNIIPLGASIEAISSWTDNLLGGATSEDWNVGLVDGTTNEFYLNRIDAGADTRNWTIYLKIKGVAQGQVVLESVIPVEDTETYLGETTLSAEGTGKSLLNGGAETSWIDVKTTYEFVRLEFYGVATTNINNSITIRTDRILATDGVFFNSSDAAANWQALATFGTLNSGNIDINTTFYTSSQIRAYGIKAQKTVINTTDISVNQTISGTNILIEDRGAFREMSGRALTDGTGAVTLTFPQPFADVQYSFVVTAANGSTVSMMYLNETTDSLQVIARDNNGAAVPTSFSWFAKGLKP